MRADSEEGNPPRRVGTSNARTGLRKRLDHCSGARVKQTTRLWGKRMRAGTFFVADWSGMLDFPGLPIALRTYRHDAAQALQETKPDAL